MSKLVAQTIIAVICALSAAVLAFYGKDGWGWLIAVTILALPGML